MNDKITIRSFLICEDMRQEVTGLQSLIGVFADKLITVQLPVQVPKLVFRIAFHSEEDFAADCSFSIVAPSGKRVFSNPQPIRMEVTKDLLNVCALGWLRAQFEEPGVYRFQFKINEGHEDVVGTLRIDVVPAGQLIEDAQK